MMSMSMGHSLTQEQTLKQSIFQHLSQRLEMRIELAEAIYGIPSAEVYRPAATCPKCGHGLTVEEILRGFKNDPIDLTTACPSSKCGHRFLAQLVNRGQYGRTELSFYCPSQALYALRNYQHDTPEAIMKNTALWESVKQHFGGLKAAFKAAGITYSGRRQPDWQKKVLPFLGQASDVLIAGVVEVSPSTIRRLRKKHGIRAH